MIEICGLIPVQVDERYIRYREAWKVYFGDLFGTVVDDDLTPNHPVRNFDLYEMLMMTLREWGIERGLGKDATMSWMLLEFGKAVPYRVLDSSCVVCAPRGSWVVGMNDYWFSPTHQDLARRWDPTVHFDLDTDWIAGSHLGSPYELIELIAEEYATWASGVPDGDHPDTLADLRNADESHYQGYFDTQREAMIEEITEQHEAALDPPSDETKRLLHSAVTRSRMQSELLGRRDLSNTIAGYFTYALMKAGL